VDNEGAGCKEKGSTMDKVRKDGDTFTGGQIISGEDK
jgi:hypothetical protein